MDESNLCIRFFRGKAAMARNDPLSAAVVMASGDWRPPVKTHKYFHTLEEEEAAEGRS